MAYTADKPPLTESIDELRRRIPGWGADRDPADRPSVPRERYDPSATGTHWDFPERQPENWPRERSLEHKFLTPVFGTSTPPRGLSGAMRKYAYAKFSEARAAHWLLLLVADRVDSTASSIRSLTTRHPDNPVTETGVISETTNNGLRSRLATRRADVKHHAIDPVLVAAPWLLRAAMLYAGLRSLSRLLGHR
jgi:hypothetical protein